MGDGNIRDCRKNVLTFTFFILEKKITHEIYYMFLMVLTPTELSSNKCEKPRSVFLSSVFARGDLIHLKQRLHRDATVESSMENSKKIVFVLS